MFQNIKVDVIYHNTNTDFEMEFNLCGCCRMRLLTDKTPDKKSLVHSLARAVSRSRIIIVVGSLFGEENIISVVGEAINSGVSTIDNSLYGIKASEEVSILKGSTPLITSEGFFGGCIVESGPQTMILLSQNRNIRKTVLNSLIHPYIEELYASDLKADGKKEEAEMVVDFGDEATKTEAVSDQSFENEDIASEDELIEEVDEESEESEQSVLEADVQSHEEPEEAEPIEYTVEKEESEPINEPDVFVMTNENIYGEEFEYDDIYADSSEDAYSYKPLQGNGGFKVPILIISILLLVLLALLCYCIFYVPSSEGVSAAEYIKDIYDTLFPATKV